MKNNRQRRIALLLNTPQRALITVAISATDLGDYLKKHLNPSLPKIFSQGRFWREIGLRGALTA